MDDGYGLWISVKCEEGGGASWMGDDGMHGKVDRLLEHAVPKKKRSKLEANRRRAGERSERSAHTWVGRDLKYR